MALNILYTHMQSAYSIYYLSVRFFVFLFSLVSVYLFGGGGTVHVMCAHTHTQHYNAAKYT